jgi:hypothetical protein
LLLPVTVRAVFTPDSVFWAFYSSGSDNIFGALQFDIKTVRTAAVKAVSRVSASSKLPPDDHPTHGVIPAKAGIPVLAVEIPAFAGMTPWFW